MDPLTWGELLAPEQRPRQAISRLFARSLHSGQLCGVRPAALVAEVTQCARLEWQQLAADGSVICSLEGVPIGRQQPGVAMRAIHGSGAASNWFPVHPRFRGVVIAWYLLSHIDQYVSHINRLQLTTQAVAAKREALLQNVTEAFTTLQQFVGAPGGVPRLQLPAEPDGNRV